MSNNTDLQQDLMDEVYNKWNTEECKDMDKLEVIEKYFTIKHKVAVQLGNMNYQVCNGGWSQWHFNGYSEDLEDLIKYSKMGIKLGIKSFTNILEILTNIKLLGNPRDYDREEECECPECSGYGFIYNYDDEDNEVEEECPECNGEGRWEEHVDGEEEYCELLSELDDRYYALDENIILNDFNMLLEKFDDMKDIDIADIRVLLTTKPKCKLTGTDGNVFSIIGRVSRCLEKAGLKDNAEEFRSKASASHSYDSVLALCFEYVDIL